MTARPAPVDIGANMCGIVTMNDLAELESHPDSSMPGVLSAAPRCGQGQGTVPGKAA